jgi:protein-disulfide isomerase
MNRDVIRLAVIAVALGAGLLAAAMLYGRSQQEEQSERLSSADASVFERPHSHTLGPADARVTIVEFLDPECESCRAMHPIVKKVLDTYRDDVRLVIRYMPLHPNSEYAAGALEAAAEQDRFWEMLDILFAYQPNWGDHHAPKPELIPVYADEIGLDMDAFHRSMGRGAYRKIVAVDRADGEALGVRGTPTIFVNQQRLLRLGLNPLRRMVEAELSR